MTRRTLFFLSLSGLAGCRRSSLPRLNIFNWSDYVAPDTIPNFAREFGVDVRYSVYESNEEMLAKVFSGNSGWDIVFPSNYFIEPMRANRLLGELDQSRLPNLASLDARLRNPEWDPQLQHSVPYMWGAAGIVYPSVRRAGGTCLACLRPVLVQHVRRHARYRFTWSGKAVPAIRREPFN